MKVFHTLTEGTSNHHHSDEALEVKNTKEAILAFMDNPHPLEILSDKSAYGDVGSISRSFIHSFSLILILNIFYKLDIIILQIIQMLYNQYWLLEDIQVSSHLYLVVMHLLKMNFQNAIHIHAIISFDLNLLHQIILN